MPLGFVVAALAIAAQPAGDLGGSAVLTASLLVGLVILDTTLVTVSRRRRGVALLTGARDHLTHRLLGLAGTPRRVAGLLAGVQLSLCAIALGASELGRMAVLWVAAVTVIAGIAVIAALERRTDRVKSEVETRAGGPAAAQAE